MHNRGSKHTPFDAMSENGEHRMTLNNWKMRDDAANCNSMEDNFRGIPNMCSKSCRRAASRC